MTRFVSRMPAAIGVGMIIVGGALAPTVHAAKGPAGKPDLVVGAGRVDGKEYAFFAEPLNLKMGYTTQNKGKRNAGRSLTEAYLKHGQDKYAIDASAVGPLKSGAADQTPLRPVGGLNQYPAGAYALVICADVNDRVRESNEQNNCGRLNTTFDSFYSTFRQWVGVISGTGWGLGGPSFSGMHESWTSQGAGADPTFTFKRYAGGGRFAWAINSAAVKFTHEGSLGPFCDSVYGSTTALLESGRPLEADYEKETYSAEAVALVGTQYPINSTCGYFGVGPIHPTVLHTGTQSLPFGTDELIGTVASEVDPGVTNTWALAGG